MSELTIYEDKLRGLTPRELAVLVHLCRGASYDEVSRELSVARRTVSYHTGLIYHKLGLAALPRAARQRELGKFCLAMDSLEGRFKLMDYHIIPYDSEGKEIVVDSHQRVSGLEVRITLDRPYGAVRDVMDHLPLDPNSALLSEKDEPSDHWFELRGGIYGPNKQGEFQTKVKLFDTPTTTEILVENRKDGRWWSATKRAVVFFVKLLCEAFVRRGYLTQPQSTRILTELEEYAAS